MADKIYRDDQITDATLTASTEATSYEKEYIYDNSPSNVWRTTSITSQTMLIDFGTAVLPLAFAWAGSNIESGDTLHTISAGTTTATSVYSESITKAGKGVHEINASWTAHRYWKITATKATGTYIEYGKMAMLFSEYSLADCYKWNYTTGYKSVFDISSGMYGQIEKSFLYTAKIFDFNFFYIKETQAELFDETLRNDDYIWYYYDDKSEVFYGVIDLGNTTHNDSINSDEYYTITMAFTEAK